MLIFLSAMPVLESAQSVELCVQTVFRDISNLEKTSDAKTKWQSSEKVVVIACQTEKYF